MKIRTKLFLAHTIVVITLLGSLTYVMNRFSSDIIVGKMKESAGYSVSQLSQNVDQLLRSYEQISDFFYTNAYFQERLLTDYDSFPAAEQAYSDYFRPLLTSIRNSKDIVNLTIFTDNPTFHFGDIKMLGDDAYQASWYQNQRKAAGQIAPKTWSVEGKDSVNGVDILRLTQHLNNQNQNNNLFFTLDIDIALLKHLFDKENTRHQYIIALPNGDVIIDSYNQTNSGLKASNYDFYSMVAHSDSGNNIWNMNGSSYLLTYDTLDSRSSSMGIKVVSVIPLEELLANTKELRQIVILLLIAALSVSIILNYGLSLYDSELNRKEMVIKTKESELYALQTQIHPHYLFNTLNAIRGNLLERGDAENADIIRQLSLSYRNILGRGGQMIALGDEMDIVEPFLKIQAFRYSNKLSYEIDIPESLKRCEIPRLSLQTLVENTIVHGVEQKVGHTHVVIRAYGLNDHSYGVSVEDNGPGISPARLEQIRKSLGSPFDMSESKQIGLRNVHQRLMLKYGKKYGLQLDSTEGEGTKVGMRLPIKYKE